MYVMSSIGSNWFIEIRRIITMILTSMRVGGRGGVFQSVSDVQRLHTHRHARVPGLHRGVRLRDARRADVIRARV